MSLLHSDIIKGDKDSSKQGWYTHNLDLKPNYSDKVQSGLVMNAMPTPFARMEVVRQAFEAISSQGVYDFSGISYAYQQLISDTLDILEILFYYNLYKDTVDIKLVNVDDMEFPQVNIVEDGKKKKQTSFIYDIIKDVRPCNELYIISYTHNGEKYALAISAPETLFIPSCRLDRKANKTNNNNIRIKRRNGSGGYFFDKPSDLLDRDKDFQDYIFHLYSANRENMGAIGDFVRKAFGNKTDNFEDKFTDKLTDSQKGDVSISLSQDGSKYVQLLVSKKPTSDSLICEEMVNIGYCINSQKFETIKNFESFLMPLDIQELAKMDFADLSIERKAFTVTVKTQNAEYRKIVQDVNPDKLRPFDIGIYPFFQYPDNLIRERMDTYNIILAYEFDKIIAKDAIELHFYRKHEGVLSEITLCERSTFLDFKNGLTECVVKEFRTDQRNDGTNLRTQHYTVVGTNFDYIEVVFNLYDCKVKGVLKPRFDKYSSDKTEDIKFAVDFGTTSTFIAVKEGDNNPVPLHTNEEAMVMLHNPDANNNSVFKYERYGHVPSPNNSELFKDRIHDLVEIIKNELLPTSIDGNEYKFPVRTAMSCKKTKNNIDAIFEDADIAFTYNKESSVGDNHFKTDLKWNEDNIQYTSLFINEIIRLCVIHAITKGYGTDHIRFLYFFPLSMREDTQVMIKKTWEKGCRDFNLPLGNLESMTESLAPYYANQINDASLILSIDIGGGSIDAVVFENRHPKLAVSTLFGCDVLWSNGKITNINDKSNPIYNHLLKTLQNKGQDNELWRIWNDITKPDSTESTIEVINFLLDNDDAFKITDELKKTKFHPIYIYHFFAILYHLAHTMNLKDVGIPVEIVMSGNGSTYLSYIKKHLEKIAEAAFGAIYGNSHAKIKVTLPKEGQGKQMTAYGGLEKSTKVTNNTNDIADMAFVYIGGGDINFNESHRKRTDILQADNNGNSILKEEVVKEICQEVSSMERSLKQLFENIDSLNVNPCWLESQTGDLRTSLKQGIETKNGTNLYIDNKRLGSTLFFIPVRETIFNFEKLAI